VQFEAETAVATGEAGEPVEEEAEPEPVDPARLPDLLIQGAAQAGFELENAQDITPEMIRLFGGLGPQGIQVLQLLTPDNLRLLQPEVIALLPAEFVETLPQELRAELDEIAAEFGGAGALALAEAEEAAELAEGAPELSGIWLEPSPEGEPSMFQTAADLLNNPFVPGAANFLNFFPTAPNVENPAEWMSALTPEVIQFLAENEEAFVETLSPVTLELFAPETLTFMLETYPDAFDAELTERLLGIAQGDIEVFVPEAAITRTDGNPSVLVSLYKAGDANTVNVAEDIFAAMDAFTEANPGTSVNLVFEQATFIEDSVTGVSREGALGGVFAVIVILLFLSGRIGNKYQVSWQATLVTAVSIPLSIFTAFLLMAAIPPTIGEWLQNLVQSTDSSFLRFISQLFPTEVTLNIMTLSGLTVAIGRVVDDSIVVLENSYRYIQQGDDPKHAVLQGTREVAIAIFSATATTMAVFIPLGLIGGIIGSFFLPFGLTVAYALAASFVVSITVVPALTYLLIRKENIPDERETTMQRWYTPALQWALQNRFYTMLAATLIFAGSLFLLAQLPQSFIPSIGEPTINVSISLPAGTGMVETNELVEELEVAMQQFADIETVQTEIGSGGGFEALFGGGISQNLANLTISVSEELVQDSEALNALTNEVRQEAIRIVGEDNVSVSAASQTGFSGFSIILTGESQAELETLVDDVKAAIESVDVDADGIPDIANVSSNVDGAGDGDGTNETILRTDGRSAVSFSGELETQNTLGVTDAAKQAINELAVLPDSVEVTEGFDSQQQVEGFQSMLTAIGYSIVIVYIIMALTFRSLIHPFTILFSLPFALVGAALALFITNSVLGISAMIGLMMLVGIVVTNGIVLMELVQQLRAKGQNVYDALVEGGRTRLRPIWMTALTAILALIPLAASDEAGAIIASELARAVMGGLLVSTALTLIVVPVVYSLSDQLWVKLVGLFKRSRAKQNVIE
jgi:HAE1 family hydrophobic/amphiphilic exporter-1